MENLHSNELQELVEELKKEGIVIKIEDAKEDLVNTMIRCGRGGGGGSCGGSCGQGSGSGGSGRSDIFETELQKAA